MTNDNEPDASPIDLGQNPEDMEIAVAQIGDQVGVRFNTLVQWFKLEPEMAIAFAEKLITHAQNAADGRVQSKLVTPSRPALIT